VAKTQLVGGSGAVHPIKIQSLDDFVGNLPEELNLCPVRTLLTYYSRVKDEGFVKDKVKLFVSYKKGFNQEIASPTVSSWIKKTIILAYSLAKNHDLVKANVHSHQVRAIAASQAFYHDVPLEQVLQAGSWSCHNTFSSFYLKDLSEENNDGYRLGPIISAQSVIHL